MKTMIVNSKIKHKSKNVGSDLVSDQKFSLISFLTLLLHIEKVPYICNIISVLHKIHYTSLKEVSKKYFMTNNLQQ